MHEEGIKRAKGKKSDIYEQLGRSERKPGPP